MLYIVQTALELGFQYALVAMALFLSYRILDIADMTTDGCFILGCAVSVTCAAAGHPLLAIPAAMVSGACAGFVTAFLQTKLGVPSILAGIVTNTGLYTVNLMAMGWKANQSLLRQDTIFMEVPFSASAELAGVLLLDDGWTSYNVGTTSVTNTQDTTLDRDPMKDTGYDAYGVYLDVTALEETADGYIARFALPLGNNIYPFYGGTSVQRNPVKHELRLRFIGRNGMAYPHYPTSVKGETENADGKDAIVSDYRYPFTFNSKTQGGEYCMWIDIPWRYSGWVRDGEETPTKPE